MTETNAETSTSANGVDGFNDLLPNDEDLLYEEELLRNPYSLKMWWRYLEARKDAAPKRRYLLFERALKALPGSYKLWYAYLRERRAAVRGLCITNPAFEALNNTFERALVSMHKMPRIWLEYLEHLTSQLLVTQVRRVFDRAVCSLPITQHDRLWQLCLGFITQPDVPADTAIRLYRRYLRLEPTHAEEYVAYLKAKGRWGEAASKLAELVNDDTFRSLEGKSKHQLWLELCDIITKHPNDVKDLKVDAILRSGIRRFTDEVGRLWISLADYYIRRSLFERARDVYEEGLTTVITVRDFTLIFDALTQFEQSLCEAKLEELGDENEEEEEQEEGDGEDFLLTDDGNDIDLRLARLEHLTERRPELLNSVMLRQNPHNCHQWLNRAKIFKNDLRRQILTYTEAVRTVDAEKAVGKPYTLWVSFAKLYEDNGDLTNARMVFDLATKAAHKYVDDLATVWCEWAEMELRHKNFKRALNIMRHATTTPDKVPSRQELEGKPVHDRLFRSLKLWSFYCDLEESLGTVDSTKAVYDKILELRIATAQIILNYVLFLQEHKYFEDSFRVYERGISLFKYPHVKDLWQAYLTDFVKRYGGKKIERTRDLFRTALDQAPPAESTPLFLQYAAFEEAHGLARSAMDVYDKAVRTVPMNQRLEVYELYINRASEFFGVGKVREIYELAIEAQEPYNLNDDDCKDMCIKYATLEKKLGEIDRARAIYVHASSLADPRVDKKFWQSWNDFEVAHGNEDTFREMLRIKRSVAASYSQLHYNTAIIDANMGAAGDSGVKRRREDDMSALEQSVTGTRVKGFVSAGTINPEQSTEAAEKAAGPPAAAGTANPEDIDIDDDDDGDDDDDNDGDVALEEKSVPDAVFGTAAAQMGALERFKKAKTA